MSLNTVISEKKEYEGVKEQGDEESEEGVGVDCGEAYKKRHEGVEEEDNKESDVGGGNKDN